MTSSPDPKKSGPLPPGMQLVHNKDLAFNLDTLAETLGATPWKAHEEFAKLFLAYDNIATSAKRKFQISGQVSLLLVATSLLLTAVQLAGHSIGRATQVWVSQLDVFCSIGAIALILWMRIANYRRSWCKAVFHRETMRLWQFQLLLDGELLSKLKTDPGGVQNERNRRFAGLVASFSEQGALSNFLEDENTPFMHPSSVWRDSQHEHILAEGLRRFRLDYQAGFAAVKVEDEPIEDSLPTLNLAERTVWLETAGRMSLLVAVLVPLMNVAVMWIRPSADATTSAALSLLALLAPALGAVVAAYRSGLTLPGEQSSYREYLVRVRALRAEWHRLGTTPEMRHSIHENLEEEAIRELRRFLGLKTKATFVA